MTGETERKKVLQRTISGSQVKWKITIRFCQLKRFPPTYRFAKLFITIKFADYKVPRFIGIAPPVRAGPDHEASKKKNEALGKRLPWTAHGNRYCLLSFGRKRIRAAAITDSRRRRHSIRNQPCTQQVTRNHPRPRCRRPWSHWSCSSSSPPPSPLIEMKGPAQVRTPLVKIGCDGSDRSVKFEN